MPTFIERHQDKIQGVLSCFDRILITGTLPQICYAAGMTAFLSRNKIRIFDYARWAEPLRDEMRAHAEKLAQKNNLEIQFIRKAHIRKEKIVQTVLEKRGNTPGLVAILSAMESCSSYKPWHDKKTHQTFLKPDSGKCLHYYFYFILPSLGLCHLRVPTWAPFRLQFYCNGHNFLAYQLQKRNVSFNLIDNAFSEIADFGKAQALSDALKPEHLHKYLDQAVQTYCPIIRHFPFKYHFSFMQVEYATDIVFKRQSDLAPIYEELIRTAIHAIKPEHVATFLGRRLTGQYQDDLGNDFHTRIEGTRIKHQMGKVAIKMYDKYGIVLRIETTGNDISFFKHHRKVEHRDGTYEMKVAPLKKSIYSLPMLVLKMAEANQRYLEFISAIDDPSYSIRDLNKISKPAHDADRTYRGFNLFLNEDLEVFHSIIRGEYNISGFKNRDLKARLTSKSSSQISRILKRLHKHGLIKKIAKTYKYYLTTFGQRIVTTALKLREMFIIPYLRGVFASQI